MKYPLAVAVFLVHSAACSLELGDSTSDVISARTVVSLTFDDTLADQFQVGDMAAARGMRVVFFVNSPRFGTSGYMTQAQILSLEQQGHEIGGHTLSHANLPTLIDSDAHTQVCNDRAALLGQGFRVDSFAYPFGADDPAVWQVVRDCAYNSSRDVGGLRSAGSCPGCPITNTVPPDNIFSIRTNDSIHSNTSLATLEQYVTDTENNGGGYVPIVFHHVCDGCDPDSITAANLAAFLDWLAQRGPATQVGTIDQEIGGAVQPAVTYTNAVKNPGLETDADGNSVPDCWQRGGYGTSSASYSLVTDAYDGSSAQRIDVTSLSSGGRRLVTAQDSGACAPPITVGHRYTMTAYYKASVAPKFTVYYRNASGSWVYFTESSPLPTSSTYRLGTFTTPAMPSGATAISVGLTIYAVGNITMDAYRVFDADTPVPPDTAPPSVSIGCNGTVCSPNAYSAPVSVSLTGWDFSGIRDIRYTTNGSDPATSGTVYSGAFTLTSTATVRALATDNVGNTRTLTKTVNITASDTTPPTLSISCNGTACASTAYTAPVSVSLAATDASGILSIRYTTDGSDPAVSGTVYSAPFTVSSTTTVRALATDNAGNTTAASQTIQITASDTTPPALTIACNGAACSSSAYTSAVSVTLTATDASGIREVRYTTDGSDPAAGTLYTGPFTVSSTSTVRAIATDNAGNSATLTQAITINGSTDTTPPTLTIACNGAGCSSTFSAPVSVTLTAADASGIREVRYTTDGSDPAAGTVYTGAFTVSSTSTVRAIATDSAGNATTLSQSITISSAPPNLLKNPSLETDADGNQVPDCWQRGGFGTNTSTYALVSDAFDGTRAQNVTITSYSSGARRLVSAQDSGACAPAVTSGRSYTMTAYYKASSQPKFSVYYRNASGSWVWFAESSLLPTASSYTQATYTTPPMPSGATAISIGLSLFGVGSLTSDAYTLVQAP